MSYDPVVAILCSDLHLRETAPSFRSDENWLEVLGENLDHLRRLADNHRCPIICAGDVFDRWNPPASLVAWAIRKMPHMYAIPGQHDLAGHCVDRRMDGAYGALVLAGKITDLEPETWTSIHARLAVYAMPWGRYTQPTSFSGSITSLVVMHKYVHNGGHTAYHGAPQEAHVNNNAVHQGSWLIGDNHVPWDSHHRGQYVFNHGGFCRTASDQINNKSYPGFLHESGKIRCGPAYPDSKKTLVAPEKIEQEIISNNETRELIEELRKVENSVPDFGARIRQAAQHAAKQEVKKVLEQLIQELG